MIKITGNYDIIVVSPEMIEVLLKKIRHSDAKELVIPAEEILPQGYAGYLARVLSANLAANPDGIPLCEMLADQLKKLKIDDETCFDDVTVSGLAGNRQFNVNTNGQFYILIKQKSPCVSYVYKAPDGKDITVTLIYE